MKQIVLISTLVAAFYAPGVYCAEQTPPADSDNFFTRTAKVIGQDAQTGVKQAGQAYKQLGNDIGHGTTKTVKDVGQSLKQSTQNMKQGTQSTGKQAKEPPK